MSLLRFIDATGNVAILSCFLHIGMTIPENETKMQNFIEKNKLSNPEIMQRLFDELRFKSFLMSPNKIYKKISLFSRACVMDLNGMDKSFFLSELSLTIERERKPFLNADLAEKWIKFLVEKPDRRIKCFEHLFEELLSRQSPYALWIASKLEFPDQQHELNQFIQLNASLLLGLKGSNLNIFKEIETNPPNFDFH